LYYSVLETTNGAFHLQNALQRDFDYVIIIEELFPTIYERRTVQELINKHKKPSV